MRIIMKLIPILILIACLLGGCEPYRYTIDYDLRETSAGGKKHACSVIHMGEGIPMHGATYCEWNYARGYADGLNWNKEENYEVELLDNAGSTDFNILPSE